MRLKLEQVPQGQEELILRYSEMTGEIEELLRYLNREEHTILAKRDGEQVIIRPADVIYLESVEGVTYLYTEDAVYASGISLAAAETEFEAEGFFRCSKSMVINLYHIDKLKSEAGNRIDACMGNGEHVIISRRYAKSLRRILKGGDK